MHYTNTHFFLQVHAAHWHMVPSPVARISHDCEMSSSNAATASLSLIHHADSHGMRLQDLRGSSCKLL